MTAPTFRWRDNCPECGAELHSAPCALAIDKDGGLVVVLAELPDAEFACIDCRRRVSFLEPKAKSELVEVGE